MRNQLLLFPHAQKTFDNELLPCDKISLHMNETPKSKLKPILLLILLAMLVIICLLGYFKYTALIRIRDSANITLSENKTLKITSDKYDQLRYKMELENDRCEKLLIKEEGNFADFSYCQKFIEFVDNNLTD